MWLGEVRHIVSDLQNVMGQTWPPTQVFLADARNLSEILPAQAVDAVITSPPYPNEKDYTRTTRLESVLLGYIKSKEDLRSLKKNLVRSNTRGVYKEDDDDQWISANHEINDIADAIERRRLELGKTSGFEKQYSRVTRLYFGGMARHLSELRAILKPGACLAYVVGDQASYLRILIRTGHLLAEIAEQIGYEVVRIDLFRNRFATATKQELREEVVILRWRGTSPK
jgi:DNA modification methylase